MIQIKLTLSKGINGILEKLDPLSTWLAISAFVMTRRIQLQEAFKLALSMMLSYWFVLWMDWDLTRYTGLAILLISLDTTGASLQKGLMRIVGTTFGLGVGFFAVACFSQDRWLNMLFLSSYLVAISYFMQESRYGYAWFVAGIVPVIVWATTYMKVDTAFHYGTSDTWKPLRAS